MSVLLNIPEDINKRLPHDWAPFLIPPLTCVKYKVTFIKQEDEKRPLKARKSSQRLLTLIKTVRDCPGFKSPHLLSLKRASALFGSTSETNRQSGSGQDNRDMIWAAPPTATWIQGTTGATAEGLRGKPVEFHTKAVFLRWLLTSVVPLALLQPASSKEQAQGVPWHFHRGAQTKQAPY